MKAAIVTFGCKVNQYESDALTQMLTQAGYKPAAPEDSDLVIINTCTVTERADTEVLKTIRRLKRRNPGVLIIGTGCLAQAHPELLAGTADLVLGQKEKEQLTNFLSIPRGSVRVSKPNGTFGDLGEAPPARTRAFYKIQDGCDGRCAYCTVPLARGRSRSQARDRVLAGIAAYLNQGIKEVVLTGIHLGRWGADLEPADDLSRLLAEINLYFGPALAGARLRLSSLEPPELGLAAEAFKTMPWLAPHLHTPFQSGSDRILTAMGRPYQIAKAEAAAKSIKVAVQDLNLGTDILVGFPGETNDDFAATLDLVNRLDFGYLHVFPFSARPGTRAAQLDEPIPWSVKKARVAALRTIGAKKKADFLASQLGRPRQALVENTLFKGRPKVLTDNYISALLPASACVQAGELVEVMLLPPKTPQGLAEAKL
jgi:threonylcarbamoyladenosine tRNA methylthiotransferase MtaB